MLELLREIKPELIKALIAIGIIAICGILYILLVSCLAWRIVFARTSGKRGVNHDA